MQTRVMCELLQDYARRGGEVVPRCDIVGNATRIELPLAEANKAAKAGRLVQVGECPPESPAGGLTLSQPLTAEEPDRDHTPGVAE